MTSQMIDLGARSINLMPQQLDSVRAILARVLVAKPQSDNVQAWVFGSRATGRARPYSDLDILISCPGTLAWRERADLQEAFEASDLPFRVDIVEESRLTAEIALRVVSERLPLRLRATQTAQINTVL